MLESPAGVLGSHPDTHFLLLNVKLSAAKFYIFCQKWWVFIFWAFEKKNKSRPKLLPSYGWSRRANKHFFRPYFVTIQFSDAHFHLQIYDYLLSYTEWQPALYLLCLLVILLGVIANLCSVAQTICIQKDWVVVLAADDKAKLARKWTNVFFFLW